MLTVTLLLAVLLEPASRAADDAAAHEFAWGDVHAVRAATLGDHLTFGLGIAPVGDVLELLGDRGEAGRSYRLSGAGAAPLHVLLDSDSHAVVGGVLDVQTLVVVETDASNGANWDSWTSVLHVVRPPRGSMATVAPEVVGALLERVVADAEALRPGVPQHVVAYGLSRSDVRPGTWVGADGVERAWAVTGVGRRTQRVVLDLDLADRGRAARFVASFRPEGVAGLSLAVRDDDGYDAPDRDLGRARALFEFDGALDGHAWVGGELDLRAGAAARDLSRTGVELHLSTAGHAAEPGGRLDLFLALVDDAGVESRLRVDLAEITPFEQEVALPLERFTAAEPALDLSRLVALRVGVHDGASESTHRSGGSLAVLDPRLVVNSPASLSPLNTFWSNEPARHASPENPLSDRFLGQPVTAYKYFHGIGGADPADTAALLADVAAIRAHGVTPHVTLELWPNTTDRVLARVLAGDYDPFFRTLFEGLAAIGGRVELAPFHEANAAWYPWAGTADPGELRAVLRRVAALRDEARAHNVALGYVVISLPSDPSTLANAVAAFPGDDAVDFVGLQGFESGYGADSVTFNELFTASAAILRRVTERPIAVTEFGFSPRPDAQHDKATLALLALADVVAGRTPVPLANLMYFNVAKTENEAWRDWRLCYEDGTPVPELAAHAAELEARAAHPALRTAKLGRDAYERRLRAHSRVALRRE